MALLTAFSARLSRTSRVKRATRAALVSIAALTLVTTGALTFTPQNAAHAAVTPTTELHQKIQDATKNLKIGEGAGVLVDESQTATPAMTDANGAAIEELPARLPSWQPITDTDMYTFNYAPLNWFMQSGFSQGTSIFDSYYVRLSMPRDTSVHWVRVEFVRSSDNTVVESHDVQPGERTSLTEFKTAYPQLTLGSTTLTTGDINVFYDTSGANDDQYGNLKLQYNVAGSLYEVNNSIVGKPYLFNTLYKTEDGDTLASYSLMTGARQSATPSEKREFTDYTYTRTVVNGTKDLNAEQLDVQSPLYKMKRLYRIVSADGSAVKSVYIQDPTYTGEVNYSDASTTGFIKVLETNVMPQNTVNAQLHLVTGQKTASGEEFITESEAEQVEALAKQSTADGNGSANAQVTVWSQDGKEVRLGFNGANNKTAAPVWNLTAGKSLYLSLIGLYGNGGTGQNGSTNIQLWNDVTFHGEVIHYYTHKKGSVVVHYVDEDGNTIAPDQTNEDNVNTGLTYNTDEDHRPSTISFNGETYEYVRVKDNNATGKVVEGTTHVTYIYRKVTAVPTTKTTIWVTTDGTVLRARTDGTLPASSFAGYRFVRTDTDAAGNTTHVFTPASATTLARTGSDVLALSATALAVSALGVAAVAWRRMRRA